MLITAYVTAEIREWRGLIALTGTPADVAEQLPDYGLDLNDIEHYRLGVK